MKETRFFIKYNLHVDANPLLDHLTVSLLDVTAAILDAKIETVMKTRHYF